MLIEIWSDVVCPWCYIGKRRLETALGSFEHADAVQVVWRSYQLDPSSPRVPTQTVAEHLGDKFGGGEAAGRQMIAQVEEVAAGEGLAYRLADAQRVNTVDAHRLLHLALTAGPTTQDELKEAIMDSYFIGAHNIADPQVLTDLAGRVGLDGVRVQEVLRSEEYADEVAADARQAAALGSDGVPFFVVDRKYAVSGAQPAEVFTELLERAWAERETAPVG